MSDYRFCVPCLFGLEGFAAQELRYLKCRDVTAENGRVLFSGGAEELAKASLWLRTGERILLKVGQTPAPSFDALFEGVKALPWENFIPRDGKFPVTGYSLNSALHSVPDCQSIIKKAIVDRLGQKYRATWLPETGAEYKIRFSIVRDVAELFLDTSGVALHKRGYRPVGAAAPMRETLAAGLVRFADYRGREPFRDAFCGSGTIAIEAAMIAMNRAPGMGRRFAAENWISLDRKVWEPARQEAKDKMFDRDYDIVAADIDPSCVELAKENARRAGVADKIRFLRADATHFNGMGASSGTLVVNPPYGERLMDAREAAKLAQSFGRAVREAGSWKTVVITSDADYEKNFGARADKKRKLYNGMIRCEAFMFSQDGSGKAEKRR